MHICEIMVMMFVNVSWVYA